MPSINITTEFEGGLKASELNCIYSHSLECEKNGEYFVYDARAVCKDHLSNAVDFALDEILKLSKCPYVICDDVHCNN